MTDAELDALAAKYRELIALRRDTGPRDDARLRRLATRFPGALREIDVRTMASLEARLVAIESARAGGAAPPWASLVSRFHGWLRVALRMRAEGVLDAAAAHAWAERYQPSEPGDPPREALDAARLAALVSPRQGRLSLAARDALGAGELDLDRVLFGPD